MTRVEKQISASLLVILSLGLIGCSNRAATNEESEAFIESFIRGANDHPTINAGIIDQRSYRDGDKSVGVVSWYKITDSYQTKLKQGDVEEWKAEIVAHLRDGWNYSSLPEYQPGEFIEILKKKIPEFYMRYIYESADGRKTEIAVFLSDF
jgi:hypothetical protein